ncbi:MAG TPA: hypothetical protein VKA27_05930, partial [Sunxiuqinia sp.]|nr:hypothetical protein [Sunxiuqinia sp.]
SETKGFIVTRASHKTVTSDACRDRKLPTIRQADSKASSKTGDFQVAPTEFSGSAIFAVWLINEYKPPSFISTFYQCC